MRRGQAFGRQTSSIDLAKATAYVALLLLAGVSHLFIVRAKIEELTL